MSIDIRVGDCLDVLRTLDAGSVQCCVTSPPYFGLRDYGHAGQIGLEATPDAFVAKLVAVFAEVRRVMVDDGTLWLNLGDTYAGSRCGPAGDDATGRHVVQSDTFIKSKRDAKRWGGGDVAVVGLKPKDLIGIPGRMAFALQADGWYLRSDIIWHKPNPMPESVADRPTKAHEYLFLLTKSERYFYDADAILEEYAESTIAAHTGKETRPFAQAEYSDHAGAGSRNGKGASTLVNGEGRFARGGRNRRSVWTVATAPYSGAHFATFPPALIEPCILAGSRVGDTVLDPFGGAGTTGLVSDRLSRNALLIELNPEYAQLARHRIQDDNPLFVEVSA